MPRIILNTVLSIRAHCYLCFNFAIIIVCNRHPMRKTQLAQICRLCGWFPWALAGFAHVSAVGWKGSCRLVLLLFAKPSRVCDSGWDKWADLALLYTISLPHQSKLSLSSWWYPSSERRRAERLKGSWVLGLELVQSPFYHMPLAIANLRASLESQDQGIGSTTAWKELQNHVAIGWL